MKREFLISFALCFIGASFLFSCQAGKSMKAPEWVNSGGSAKYPSSAYLIGIGSARDTSRPEDDRSAADESARVNLASQIRVRVDSELSARVAERSRYNDEGASTEGIQEVESLIRSRVEIELSGVEFAERYHDPKNRTYYTLTVLDRARAAADLKDEIEELRAEGGHYYDEGESLAEKNEFFDSLRALKLSLECLAEAEAKEAMLRVIQGKPVSHSWDGLSPWEAGARINEVRSKLRYVIKIYEINPFSEAGDLVEGAIVARLSDLGLKAVHAGPAFSELSFHDLAALPYELMAKEIGDRACYLIAGEVEAKKSSRTRMGKRPFYFFKSRADVKMINVLTGKVILAVAFDWEEETKAGSARKDKAAALSLEKAGDLIADRLYREIVDRLYVDLYEGGFE